MKLSEKKKQELYDAIAERVMNLRIELNISTKLDDKEALDSRMFDLVNREIWPDVKQALNIKD